MLPSTDLDDPFYLQRFVDAQSLWYENNLAHIQQGLPFVRHLWVNFPRLRRLRQTERSHFFGLSSLAAARAYLAHPELGPRLAASVQAILNSDKPTLLHIFPERALTKLQASMTLFASVDDQQNSPFRQVLDLLFDGKTDAAT